MKMYTCMFRFLWDEQTNFSDTYCNKQISVLIILYYTILVFAIFWWWWDSTSGDLRSVESPLLYPL